MVNFSSKHRQNT